MVSLSLEEMELLLVKAYGCVGCGRGACHLMVLRSKSPVQGLRARKNSCQQGTPASCFLCSKLCSSELWVLDTRFGKCRSGTACFPLTTMHCKPEATAMTCNL